MNKFFTSVLAASLLLGSAASVSAADYEFYVRNRPFSGTASISGRSVSASMDDVLKALGFSWTVEGNTINLYNSKGKGPAFVSSGNYTIKYDGHTSNITLNAKGGRAMVDVASLAKALDLKYNVSDNLNTIDLLIPMSKSKAAAVAAAAKPVAKPSEANGAKDNKAEAKKSKYTLNAEGKMEAKYACPAPGSVNAVGTPESKVVINSVDWFINDVGSFITPAEVHLDSVSLTNTGDEVTEVSVKVDAVYYDGYAAYTWNKSIGTMAAGQSETFVPDPLIWNNNNRTPITLLVTVTHNPPAEKEEPVKKKKKNTADIDDLRIGHSDSKVGGIYRVSEEEEERMEAEQKERERQAAELEGENKPENGEQDFAPVAPGKK